MGYSYLFISFFLQFSLTAAASDDRPVFKSTSIHTEPYQLGQVKLWYSAESDKPENKACEWMMRQFQISIASARVGPVSPEFRFPVTSAAGETWRFIEPSYLKESGLNAAEIAASKKKDALLPLEHTGILQMVGSDGRTKAWIRFVSNIPVENLIGDRDAPAKFPSLSGILPVEEYPGLTRFLDKQYPIRVEIGRLVAEPHATDPLGRVAGFLSLLTSLARTVKPEKLSNPPVIIGECLTRRLQLYTDLGFREIPAEEVQKHVPGFQLPRGRHLIQFPVEEIRRLYGPGKTDLLPSPEERISQIATLQAHLEREVPEFLRPTVGPVYFAIAEHHFHLRDYEKASMALQKVEHWGNGDTAVTQLRNQIDLASQFDPVTRQGSPEKALKFLDGQLARTKTQSPSAQDPGSNEFLKNFWEIWIQLSIQDRGKARQRIVELWWNGKMYHYFQPDTSVSSLLINGSPKDIHDFFDKPESDLGRSFEYQTHFSFNVIRALENVRKQRKLSRYSEEYLALVQHYQNRFPYALNRQLSLYSAAIMRGMGQDTKAEIEVQRANLLREPNGFEVRFVSDPEFAEFVRANPSRFPDPF